MSHVSHAEVITKAHAGTTLSKIETGDWHAVYKYDMGSTRGCYDAANMTA